MVTDSQHKTEKALKIYDKLEKVAAICHTIGLIPWAFGVYLIGKWFLSDINTFWFSVILKSFLAVQIGAGIVYYIIKKEL